MKYLKNVNIKFLRIIDWLLFSSIYSVYILSRIDVTPVAIKQRDQSQLLWTPTSHRADLFAVLQ